MLGRLVCPQGSSEGRQQSCVFVPLVPQLQGEADLDVRDHPFVQKEVIGGELAALPDDTVDPPLPDRPDPAHAAPDRHAGALDRRDDPSP